MFYFTKPSKTGEPSYMFVTSDPDDPAAEGLIQIPPPSRVDYGNRPTPASLEDQLAEVITKAKNTI